MHKTAMMNGENFFSTYSKYYKDTNVSVLDIGSQDVNGSLKQICPKEFKYIGLDFEDAKGVDIVLQDPYNFPFDDQSVDIVVSSSCFEHSEMFWLTFLEILRILKPNGIFYLNAPSDGHFHRYPVDCWRFYPDSGQALVKWAKKSGYNPILMESFIQTGGIWQDYVAIFLKDFTKRSIYKDRIIFKKRDFENGMFNDQYELLNVTTLTQNERKINLRSFKGIVKKILPIQKLKKYLKLNF